MSNTAISKSYVRKLTGLVVPNAHFHAVRFQSLRFVQHALRDFAPVDLYWVVTSKGTQQAFNVSVSPGTICVVGLLAGACSSEAMSHQQSQHLQQFQKHAQIPRERPYGPCAGLPPGAPLGC